jgi:hypothetical protein
VSASGVVGSLLRRPGLWPVAVRQGWRIGRGGPPARSYVRFRMVTQYGGVGRGRPTGEDVVAYLTWCRSMGALDS